MRYKIVDGLPIELTGNELSEIEAREAEWNAHLAEEAKTQYQRDRQAEYPSIGDQLDALFHAGVFPEEMAAQLQAVKDAHPKP